MARNLLILLFSFTVLLLASCARTGEYLDVIEGNYTYSRGEYMDANFNYIQAGEYGSFRRRIAYNLGNVYHSLGESEAAIEEWGVAAREQEDPQLLYRIAFNRGVLSYELGEYQEAYSYFRQALRINPEDLEAKANLEFCLRKLNLRNEPDQEVAPEEKTESPEERGLSEDGRRILEYMRRSTTTFLEPDYAVEEDRQIKDW